MNLSQQVCALDYAKKLKELDVKQETSFYWVQEFPDAISAYTVAELGDIIPYCVDDKLDFYYPNYTKRPNYYRVQLISDTNKILVNITDDAEANLRTKLLIYLIENELVKVEDVNKCIIN